MDDVKEIREKIDDIDRRLTELFVGRMKMLAELAKQKKEQGLPITDAERELDVLEKVYKAAGEGKDGEYAKLLYQRIFELSREYQKNAAGIKDRELGL